MKLNHGRAVQFVATRYFSGHQENLVLIWDICTAQKKEDRLFAITVKMAFALPYLLKVSATKITRIM